MYITPFSWQNEQSIPKDFAEKKKKHFKQEWLQQFKICLISSLRTEPKWTGEVAEEEECDESVVVCSGAVSGVFGINSKLCCVP